MNDSARVAAELDRFRHLTFLGDRATNPAPDQPRLECARLPTHDVDLDGESVRFYGELFARWGLLATRYRNSILARRQAACLRAMRAPTRGAPGADDDPVISERAFSAVMIGVTGFFRDPAVFEALRPLLRSLRRSRPLRVLSAGCSDGAELYSLAILLAEEGMLSGAWLEGIDCRPGAVRSASEGISTCAAAEAVPLDLRRRYFAPAEAGPPQGSVQIVEELRRVCRWRIADVFDLPSQVDPAERFDLILCRNVAIYLTPTAAAELWALCAANLAPGGLLVSGKAERPHSDIPMQFTRLAPCIYRRNGER